MLHRMAAMTDQPATTKIETPIIPERWTEFLIKNSWNQKIYGESSQ